MAAAMARTEGWRSFMKGAGQGPPIPDSVPDWDEAPINGDVPVGSLRCDPGVEREDRNPAPGRGACLRGYRFPRLRAAGVRREEGTVCRLTAVAHNGLPA